MRKMGLVNEKLLILHLCEIVNFVQKVYLLFRIYRTSIYISFLWHNNTSYPYIVGLNKLNLFDLLGIRTKLLKLHNEIYSM